MNVISSGKSHQPQDVQKMTLINEQVMERHGAGHQLYNTVTPPTRFVPFSGKQ